MNSSDPSRRTDIDVLRILATFLLFPFHVAMIFSPAPFYHVRNGELSTLALIFTQFVSLWHMPLFFLLAGWSAVSALRARGGAAFRSRASHAAARSARRRLRSFRPAIKYVELSGGQDLNRHGLFIAPERAASYAAVIKQSLPTMAPFNETFAEFLPTYFTNLDRFTWSHLWFVAYLFTLSVVWSPVLVRLARPRERGTDQAMLPALVYAPIVPLALVQVFLRPYWPGVQNLYDDWANVAYYSTYLIVGASLASFPRFEEAVEREWRRALGVSLATLVVLLGAVLGLFKNDTVILTLSAVASWSFVVFLLGGARRLDVLSSRTLTYFSEASMPIYVLHQPAIVAVAWLVVGWPLGIAAKYTIILLGAVTTTLLAYDVLVRRTQPLRLALGMKPRASAVRVPLRAGVVGSALVLVLAATAAAGSTVEPPIGGLWWAEGGAAQVRLEPCGGSICGRVVWLRSPFDENGCVLRDRHNADPALRTRDVLGMEILSNLVSSNEMPDEWSGGSIYDPTSGHTFDCAVRFRGPDRLEIRGYLGFRLLGRTVTWTRVGSEDRVCRE